MYSYSQFNLLPLKFNDLVDDVDEQDHGVL